MDSSYFGNERPSASSSSTKAGKKNNSDKPKQPQRGLGVAQLEKIRLHGQIACGYHPSLHPPYPSNFNNELQLPLPSSSTSYSPSYAFQPNIMDTLDIDTRKHRNGSVGSNSQSSESSDTQELDLELRLSL
ncbi:hypothetical protein VNO78_10142 [Psophocarpus tetragonolobus]|uniref:Uncharacterized protein n=1 Tax=Psophocarpus tetragonolobus TaxID=3891 RepID=A0AAN9SQY0_PSOTE